LKLYTVNKINKSRKAANGSQPKQISRRNANLLVANTPVRLRPDHRIVIKHIQKFTGRNAPGGYFDLYEQIKPIDILTSSSYAPLWGIYESVRVSKITAQVWLTNVSMATIGRTSAMLYRDIITQVPNRYYEQLIVEPGSSKGSPTTKFTLTWIPIEPSDYEFYDHNQVADMDSGKYGQINFAGAGFDSGFKPTDLIEFTMHYDFKSLVKPEAPPQNN
jgi:hypothetical protein